MNELFGMPDLIESLAILFCITILGYIGYMYYQGSDLQLTCVISTVDGNKYCVRDRKKVKQAANLLASVAAKLTALVDYMKQHQPNHPITQQLSSNYDATKIMETLPTSAMTAYSENKGEKVAFCLNRSSQSSKTQEDLIDEHTLTFVGIHELTHVGTASHGHQEDFWQNFKFLLEQAKQAGIHQPIDYKAEPTQFCGMTIRDNPFYDV